MTQAARSVQRPSTSFKLRRRSLSAKRQAELQEWMARWGVDVDGPALSWHGMFGRDGDVVLDVGFGHGESTIQMAINQPDIDVIAVEVHTPGVVTLLDSIVHSEVDHIRVVHGDLLPFLDRVPEQSLAGVRVYFPDPWPKARHAHRRLLAPDVIAALTDRLRPGGELHMATDMAYYAMAIEAACDAEPRLAGGVINRPNWRPLTRFEKRGLDEDRIPTDLLFVRTRPNPVCR